MSIKVVISNVLEKRHKKVDPLKKLEKEFKEIENCFGKLNRLSSEIKQDFEDISEEIESKSSILEDQIRNHENELQNIRNKIKNLIKRFNRKTINIGVAGRARQGKSTLLQSITNLSDTVIPTSDKQPCTGAKSNIFHKEGAYYAEIEFYSEKEFLQQIIYPYFRQLKVPKPISLEDFQVKGLPEFNLIQSEEKNINQAFYENLKAIHHGLPEYRNLFSTKKQIKIDEVVEYVTQKDGRTKFFAVKSANIYTEFPNHDVAGLCLVDLPGLEAAQDHEKQLAKSLEHETDAMILIKLPSSQGDFYSKDDYKVIDLVHNSATEITPSDWLFLILNELQDHSNSTQVKMLIDAPPNSYDKLTILSGKCSDPSDVNVNIFSVILEHLEDRLERMDGQRIDALREKVKSFSEEITSDLINARKHFNTNDSDSVIRQEFNKMFKKFMIDLKSKLDIFLDEVKDSANQEEYKNQFLKKIEEICDSAEERESFVPPVEVLKHLYHDKGAWPGVVQEQLHYIRSHLTKHLSLLDSSLEDMIEKIFDELINIVIPNPLKDLVDQYPEKSARNRMKKFGQEFNEQDYPNIYSAFQYISNFSFSYHSHFHYRVREEMRSLDPSESTEFVNENIPQNAKVDDAGDIERALQSLFLQAIYRIRTKLTEEMQADPSKAFFALVEEIRDRLTRSENVENEWDDFIYRIRGNIWPNTFDRFEKEKIFCDKCRTYIKNALESVKHFRSAFENI